MAENHRKKRKGRGAGTGYGAKKKHRGKGSQGGKGWGGSTKHNRSYVYSKDPFHFGRKGFHRRNRKEIIAINVGELEKISSGKKEIDLRKLGYGKLLGRGEIKSAFRIEVDRFSKSAKEKIESAGGSIIEKEIKEL
jgi:large subunit ribosomal protein L15